MASLKKYLSLIAVLLFLLPTTISSTEALGPADIHSSGGGGHDIAYVSIQNESKVSNPVNLMVCAKTFLIPYCYTSVGDIGYSINGDYIHNMVNVINQTIVPEGSSDSATVWAYATLPTLSEGSHTVTVYFGRQTSTSYDVTAYKTVNFSITSETSNLPSPSVPEFPTTILLVAVLAAATLLLIISKRKIKLVI